MRNAIHCLAAVCASFGSLTAPPPGAAADKVVVQPKPQLGPLDNPLKGWCPYTDAGVIRQPYSMVFQYVSWRELEPIEGEYRFDQWERSWNVEAARDKHILFRIYIDYPSKKSGLPDWLRAAGVKETPYDDYGGGLSPDYNDPRLVAALERLIAALGRRYDAHPRIAFVQLGLLGFWGEWHTYPRTELYASAETERRVIAAYRKAFPHKSLMVRYARGDATKQDWIGFHDDMFPEDTDNGQDWSFLAGLRKAQRMDNWQVAVVGGEMVPGQAAAWLGDQFETTRTMLERAHFTWVGPYCPALATLPSPGLLKHSQELVRRMGYEFQITEVTHSAQAISEDPVEISLRGENRGVAPFYYPWKVEWALLDRQGQLIARQETDWDIRRWRPGPFTASQSLVFRAAPGTYRLALGIRDPWKNKPAIRFANDLPVHEGWTILSEFKVLPR